MFIRPLTDETRRHAAPYLQSLTDEEWRKRYGDRERIAVTVHDTSTPAAETSPMDVARGIVARSESAPADASAKAAYAELARRAGLKTTDLDEAVAAARMQAVADSDEAEASTAINRSLAVSGFDAPAGMSGAQFVMFGSRQSEGDRAAKKREQMKVRRARIAAGLSNASLEAEGRERLD